MRERARREKSSSKKENSLAQIRKADHSQSNSPLDQILFLQRTIGNQAVQRLVKSGILLQRQADIKQAPPGLPCILTTGKGHLPGTDILFGLSSSTLSDTHKKAIADFVKSWVARGSLDDVIVDGYASIDGPQGLNWQFSCDRAEAVKAELTRLHVPAGKITTLAHGETTEFSSAALPPNRRAILSTISAPPAAPACGPPPSCPVGGTAPLLRDPHIPSGALCRGACGPDCPPTCTPQPDVHLCVPDSSGSCHHVCTYTNVIECGSHQGCRDHDDCYDRCAAAGERDLCYAGGTCHCGCDMACIRAHGIGSCNSWRTGGGPFDRMLNFSDPPTQTGPSPGACPP